MSWASYAADPSRPFWGARVLRQRASVDVKNPGLGLIATRPGLEQLVDRRIAHRGPCPPARHGHESPAKRGKSSRLIGDRFAGAARGPPRGGQFGHARRSSRSYRLRAGDRTVEDARHEEASARDGGARRPVSSPRRRRRLSRPRDRRSPSGRPSRTGSLTADFNGDGRARRGDRQRDREQRLGASCAVPAVSRQRPGRRSRRAPDPATASSADFNGDGLPDVATQNFNDGTVEHPAAPAGRWLRRRADTERRASTGSVTAADFNGDGRARHRRTELQRTPTSSPT